MPAFYKIKNWEQYQHYKDRNPPWIKLYIKGEDDVLRSDDWLMANDNTKLLMIACMMIAGQKDGLIPNRPLYIQKYANLGFLPDFKPLVESGFLVPDTPECDDNVKSLLASCQQDDSSMIAERYQDASGSLASCQQVAPEVYGFASSENREQRTDNNNNNSAYAPEIFDFEELSENERKVAEAIGIERLKCSLERVQEWVTAGYDIDQDVVPAIKATLKKYPKQAINSLSYFDDPIKRRRDKGELPPKAANNPPADKPKQTIDPDGIMPKVLRDVAKSNADLGVGADVMRRSIIGLGFGGKRDGTVYLHQPQGNQALCQSLNDDYGHKFLEYWRCHDATVTAVRVVVAS